MRKNEKGPLDNILEGQNFFADMQTFSISENKDEKQKYEINIRRQQK